MNVDWLMIYSVLGLQLQFGVAREAILCMITTITPVQLRTLVKKRIVERGWYNSGNNGFWFPTREIACHEQRPYLMLPEETEILFLAETFKDNLPVGSHIGTGFIFDNNEIRINKHYEAAPYAISKNEYVSHFVFYQQLWHHLTARFGEYKQSAPRQKMNSPKRQRLDSEEKWIPILDEFEKLWSKFKTSGGFNREFYTILVDDHFRKHITEMKVLESVNSLLLRSRLWRWWEKARERQWSPPTITTIYNLLSPLRQQKFFKIFIVQGEMSALDICAESHLETVLHLLQPDDNMAIFYRYFYSPNMKPLSRQRLADDGIFNRLPVTPIEGVLSHWDVLSSVSAPEYIRRFTEENKKFKGYPVYETRVYVHQFRAFREWLCCYLMLGHDCDTPILEAFVLNFR
jgi:hypothetical protein